MGKEGQVVPEMNDEWIQTISKRYIELYEKVIGAKFIPETWTDVQTFNAIEDALTSLL